MTNVAIVHLKGKSFTTVCSGFCGRTADCAIVVVYLLECFNFCCCIKCDHVYVYMFKISLPHLKLDLLMYLSKFVVTAI